LSGGLLQATTVERIARLRAGAERLDQLARFRALHELERARRMIGTGAIACRRARALTAAP
jgi:hypothetical protein